MTMTVPVHSWDYRMRRVVNWLPMGLAYAFLYMGRYNLNVAQDVLGENVMSKNDFGTIFAIGAIVYTLSFFINGPIVDRHGGRLGMLIGVGGAMVCNFILGFGLYADTVWNFPAGGIGWFTIFYALNMYFQSFGAASIVTVKASWFHVRERGTFSTIFGVLISLGIYFAFDWGSAIADAIREEPRQPLGITASIFKSVFNLGTTPGTRESWMLFFIPSIFMGAVWMVMYLSLRNTPADAGLSNIDTGEDNLAENGEQLPVLTAIKKAFKHPVLFWVCIIELCSGAMRNGTLQWYPKVAKAMGFKNDFIVSSNWGLAMLICGISGALLTGYVSDKVFRSRRGPMATVLYAVMCLGVILLSTTLPMNHWYAGIGVLSICLSVIGVHGILSGTATADFGGARNTAIMVGIVDGSVYLGTSIQSYLTGKFAPVGDAARDAQAWISWPLILIPFALLGVVSASKIWHALPRSLQRST